MKKYTFLLLLFVVQLISVNAQFGPGLPVWLHSNPDGGDFITIDWRLDPPNVNEIVAPDLVDIGGTGVAFDDCGRIAFYVVHDGSIGQNGLFIFSADGTPLLTSTTPNGPGLNSISQDAEIQVIKAPTYDNEWYIIYKRWRTSFGSPNNDGNYATWNIFYARVRYDGTTLTVLERDVKFKDNNNIEWQYMDGKAASRTGPVPNSHYLYLHRRTLNSLVMEGHRYIITADTITFDKATGEVPVDWFNLAALGSIVELSPSEDRVAMVNRNAENDRADIVIFQTDPFNNAAANYEIITGNELILQPDGVNILTPMSIEDAATMPGMGWLINFDRKLSKIEFSPNGRFLYIGGGGFVSDGLSNVNYLAQVDLNSTYPYDIRLQVEDVPFGFNSSDGSGCVLSDPNCSESLLYVSGIQGAPNGNLYFRKRYGVELFVIPNPNDTMPQMITPGSIDLSTPSEPNVYIGERLGRTPDQIDGFQYLDEDIVNFEVIIRKEPCIGTCVDYQIEALVNSISEESFDIEACIAENYFDTLIFCVDTDDIYDISEVGGITYDSAIINGVLNYPPEGYFDFTVDPGDISIDLGADTILCSNASLTLDAGAGFVTYAWNTGASGQTINVTSSGTYGLLGTTVDGCLSSDSIDVTFNPGPPVPDIGPDTTYCESISLLLDAGDVYDTYLWNDNSTGQTLLVTSAGTYSVQVTDTCGVVQTDQIVVTDGTANQINLGEDSLFCGAVNIVLSTGGGFASYAWSTGASTPSITATTPGTYSVTATNASGCTTFDEIILTNVTPSPPPALGDDIVFCSDTTITLTAGPGPYLTYDWSTGATTSSIDVTAAGTYSVEVTDSCGTIMTDAITISDGSQNDIDLGEDTTFCGAVSLTLNAGAGFVTYNWSTGASTQTININGPGVYSVTATTSDGCTASGSITVMDITPSPPPALGDDIVICGDTTITLTAGPGPYLTFDWSTGATTSSIDVSAAGTYSVEVTDSCGTIMTDAITISDGSQNDIDLGEDTTFCGAVSLTLNAGAGFVTYNWSTGASTQTIIINGSGVYSVTATTSDGCTASGSITVMDITPSDPPELGSNIVICGDTTITLTAGPGPYLTYDWSTGATTPSISVSDPGVYSVEVTDSCGNIMSDDITLIDGSQDDIDLGEDTTFCGAVNLLLDAGSGFATYDWSSGESTQTITVTGPGVYTVTGTTASGCSASGSITVTDITPSAPPNLGDDIVICSDTTIILTASPGPYLTYDWSTGATTSSISVTDPGTYSVEVTDSCGNIMSDEIMIIDGSQDDIDLGRDTTFCGVVNLTIDAGGGFETYDWSTGESTQTITVTGPGVYAVTATTASGCSASGAITVTDITPSAPPNLGDDIVICSDTTITLTASPGPYLTYDWSTGATTSSISVTDPGTYSVEVTDSCGNIMSDEIMIIDGSQDDIDLGSDTTFCGAVNLTIDAGAGFDTYDWSTGESTQTITVNGPGVYTVIGTTASGCSASGAITVTDITPSPAPDLGNDIIICGDTSITLDLGSGPYLAYEWSDGSTGATLEITEPGTYAVEVTDSCDNVMTDTIGIIDGSNVEIDLGEDTIFCGAVSLTLDAGAGFDTYDWSNGETTQVITVTSPGTITVAASTAAGCSASDEIVVGSITPSPPPDLGADAIICGGLSIILDPGQGPYLTYEWNDGSIEPVLTVTEGGTYTVEVTDSCGNIMSDTIEIQDGVILDITGLLQDNALCSGTTLTLGGSVEGTETYEWTSGGTVIGNDSTLTVDVDSDTSFVLTVTNICGSSIDTASFTVLESPTAEISGDAVLCTEQDSGLIQIVLVGGIPPYDITVTNGTDDIVFDDVFDDTLQIYVSEPGTYTISGFEGSTCEGSSSGQANITSSEISFEIATTGDPCLDTEGSITVINVAGGVEPYTYSINGGSFTSENVFSGLGTGTYSITVMDDAGCTASTSQDIDLEFAEEYDLTAYGDTTILQGESTTIGITIDPASVDPDISWSPDDVTLSCTDCPTPIASPEETTTYTVTTTDELGCTKTESVTIIVEIQECSAGIPNAFSPNGDDQNDILFIRLEGEYNALDFRIYNRWGELVFQTDDVSVGWDGIYEGKLQSTDVFGYYFELECTTGEIIQQQGNITLLR